jgi:hypothetical protein
MAQIHVDILTLCDFAQTTADGKLNLLGIFDRFFINNLPSHHPRFFIVAVLSCKDRDQAEIKIRLESPTGQDILPAKTILIKFGTNGKSNLITDVSNLELPEVGEYHLTINYDGQPVASTAFYVTQLDAPKDKKLN